MKSNSDVSCIKRDTPELLVVWPSGSRDLIMYRADFQGPS